MIFNEYFLKERDKSELLRPTQFQNVKHCRGFSLFLEISKISSVHFVVVSLVYADENSVPQNFVLYRIVYSR